MGLAGKNAFLFRRTRIFLIQLLSLLLIVSTISAISIPRAQAAAGTVTNSSCSTIVGETSLALITQVGNDCVVTFNAQTQTTASNSNSWTVPTGVREVSILVVAGGGAGGTRHAGGGGAGGLVYLQNVSVIPDGNIAISVGGGGAGVNSNASTAAAGSNSSVTLVSPTGTSNAITALGGSGGGNNSTLTVPGGGSSGGNGNGNAPSAATQGSQNYGFGYTGGIGVGGGDQSTFAGGGGGGAGGAGVSASNSPTTAGRGGLGKIIPISGNDICYAAGGGGGAYGATAATLSNGGYCTVGQPVGGSGSLGGDGVAGTAAANTGSGGGGGGFNGGVNATPGSGAAGVVIIRWTLPSVASAFPNVSGMSARFNAANFNTTLNSGNGTWADTSGSGFHIAGSDITGGSTGAMSAVTSTAANGSANTFTVVQGTTASTISMLSSAEMTGKYTLFTVARYNAGAKGRIFQGTTGNWLHGFYGGWTGVMHKEGWYTPYADYFGNNWVMSSECSHDATPVSNSCLGTYSAQGKQKSHTLNTISTAYGLAVNTGAQPTEDSDYQIADVLVFNRVLSIVEENQVETYLSKKYGIAIYSDLAANYDPGAATNGFTNGGSITHGAVMKDIKKDASDSLILTDALDMSLYGGVTYSSSNGGVLNFTNGADRYGQSQGLIRSLPKFSASIWAKFSGTQTTADASALVTQAYWAGGQIISPVIYYAPSAGTGKVGGGFYDGGTWRTSLGGNSGIYAGVQATADTWAHYTVTYDGANVSFYVNGVLQSSSAATQNPMRESYLRMATRWDGGAAANGFGGSIGLLKVYDHGLSQSEVTADYSSAAARYFVNTAAPTISGTVRAGQALTASSGTWSGATITGYAYQWSRATTAAGTYTDISGATSSTYVVADGDTDKYLKVTVTASTSMGSLSSTSAATSIVTINCSQETTTANGYTTTQIKYVGTCIWTAPANITKLKALLVGGGGGGGAWVASGGGGGGVVENSSVTVSPNTEYNFFIASGGTGSTMTSAATFTAGTNGGDTTALGLTAYGGGLGGSWTNLGLSRATGGGGSYNAYATPLVSPYTGQGFIGGVDGNNGTYGYPTGGGGGAGAAGQAGTVTAGVSGKSGNGGAGKATDITGSTTYFGGGGGGGCHGNASYPCTSGTGGSGGGGDGGGNGAINTQYLTRNYTHIGSAGTANTGGGGGGAGAPSTNTWSVNSQGGAGGSGIVIISYVSTYTVTYNYDSATGGNTTASATYAPGATALVLPTPTKTGNIFAGWFAEAGLTTSVGSAGANYTPSGTTAAVTLYAKWTLNSNTYAYNGNTSDGGTTPTGGGSKSYGATVTVAANTFTKTGYTFANWNTAADGSGTTYAGTGSVTFTMPDVAVTLYAQWTLKTYAITFKSGTSGNGADQILSKTHGSAFTTPDSTTANSYFTRVGYTVSGWSGTDGGSQSYALGASYTTESATNLYPVWSAASNSVIYDVNGGSTLSNGSFLTGGTLSKPTNPTKSKKIFGGWSTSETSDQGNIANLIRTWPYSPVATSSLTLYAIWHDDYSVNFAGTAKTWVRTTNQVLADNSSFSWEAWIYPTGSTSGTTQWFTILENGRNGNNYGRIWMDVTDSGSGPFLSGGYWKDADNGTGFSAPVNSITYNTWQHVAVTYERSGSSEGSCVGSGGLIIKAYVNGALVQSATDSVFAGCVTSPGLNIGAKNTPYDQRFIGRIDQVKIWNGVLTLAEIESSRTNYSVGSVDNTLRAQFGFNDLIETPALNNVVKNLASEASTYDLAIYNESGSDATNNLTRFQNSYQVSYSGNTSNSGSVSAQTTLLPYESVTTSTEGDLVKTGYTFLNWNTLANGSGTSISTGASLTSLYGNTALYATWTANSNTVTFNANDGSGTPATSTQSITSGTATALTANAFTRTGYTFAGWDAAADGSGTDYTNQQSVTITGSMTLYAKWTANSNTFIFNNNTGSGTMANQTITTGSATAISTNTFTKSGYSFTGWNTSAGGTGTSYSDGQSITVTAGTTLYAQWSAASNTITFNNNTGSGTMANQSITSGTATALNANTLTKTGYTFASWNTVAGGGGTSYTDGQSVTVSAGATLYAQWTANSNTFIFDNNTGSGTMANQSITSGTATALTSNTFTKTGYTFASWNTAADASGTSYTNGQIITITAGTTLYAQWTANSNTFVFNNNTGTGTMTNQSITSGTATALTSNTFNKTGFTFGGWNTLANGSGTSYTDGESVTITAGATLYAQWTVNGNTFAYNGNSSDGGSAPAGGGSKNYATTVTVAANTYTKAGYTFSGWNTAANGSGTAYAGTGAVTFSMPDAAVTLYAQWTINSNTFAYNGNTSDGGSAPTGGGSKNYATTITVAANTFTKTGFTFTGWNTAANGSGTAYAGTGAVTFSMPDAAVTLYAQWTGDSNNFVFDSNTGSGTMATQSITSGTATALTSNTFTKSGYTFSSWNTSANGSGTSYTDGQSITITAGATLYAQWTANSNSFVFDSNTGSGTLATQLITSGTPTALTTNSFTKAGYTFAGWNTAANNSGTSYSNSQSITITAGATLYAQWTINANTFAYNGNTNDGGSAPSGGGTKNYATTITVAANSYTKTGYTFDSWNTAANGSGTSYADTGSVTFSMPDAAVTLYAQWIANTNTFAYNGNTSTSGSAPTGGGTKSYGATITVAANTYTKTGYSFTGWNTAANGSGTTYAGTGLVTFVMPDAAVTLYAQWSANTLVITFNSQGGSSVTAGSTVTAGSISAAPTPPTKANYEFAGWATSIGGTAITFAYTHGQTADFTLYALWTANQYTVTYVYNSATSGNGTATASFTTGGTAITLPTPLRTGYNFDGWYSDSLFANSIGAAGGSYSPTGSSLTLSAYAKWAAINYTVTYSAAVVTSGAVPVDSNNYIYANNVIIKGNTGSLVRTGYTFLGWTSASDGSSTLLTSGSTFSTPAANMTFYAKWSANTYTVTYNKNGASGSPTLTSDSYTTGGTAVTLTSVGNMVKTGFDFSGWSATPTGSVLSGGYTTASNVTLYAIWTIKTIAITFAKGSAINEAFFNFPANRSASYGTLITLSDTIDSSIDIAGVSHAFMGWNDGYSIYQSGATYLLGETAPTFTAVWVKIYAVRYAFNGGTAAALTSAVDAECQQTGSTCLNGQVITSNAAPTKTGYDFAGWVDQNNLSVPTAATFTVSSSRYLIYATWTAVNYAITYDANGGASTPSSFTKQIGQTFTVANAISKTGYTFNGWSDGTSVFGAGATYYVSSSPVTLTAQWTANIYTVIYDWNGGSGSTTANTSYTVGTTAITLPVVGDHVKDGYNFSGWSTSSSGGLISGGYTPTADINLYAIWGTGSYTVTYNANYGTVSTSSESILNGTSLTLPTPTRDNFVFDGWFTALTGGSKVGDAGASHQPTQSKTLYARWIQSSIYGIDPATLTRLGVTTARTGTTATFLGSNATSSVSVTVPAGALPDGTTVNFDLVGDYSRAQSVLTGTNNYIISMVVSWLAPDQTVPNTNTGKAISLTVTNSSIKAGASVYAIVAGAATLMGTATQDGTVTVAITSDPEVVVISTKPTAPTSVTATSNAARESLVSWSAPSTDGGSAITGYTVTASNNQTCTTSTTSCTVTGLLDATSYTFTVTATNSVGTSVASTSASATTAGKPTAPTALSATSNEIQQTVLTWTAPSSNGGSAITGYTVTANTGATCSTTVLTTCVISGLTNGVTYTFTVTAMNIAGTSPASSSASATTANIPGAPTSVTASSGEIKQSVISWNAPASNGGSTITGYTVTANTGETCTTSSTTCTITGLSDGVTYTFTVIATNAVGPSTSSSSATAKTVELPGAPTSVAATSAGDKRSVISWTAPASNGGSPIISYTVTSNTNTTCTTSTTTCSITGLNDGTTYTFTVIATNILGDSLASVSASGRTADAVVVAPPVIWVSAQPAPAPAPVVPSQPETPLTVVGSNEVKVPALEVKPVETKPVDPKPVEVTPEVKPEVKPEIKPTTVSVDSASKKFISEVKIVNGEVILLPELGFSGKKTVTVTISENGVERSAKIGLVVLPEVVTKPTIVPASSARSTIRWTESPNATNYTVYLDGKKVCTTSGTNCTINKVLGPNASVEIVSNGGDKTLSQKVEAELKLTSTVVLGQLVSTTLTKAILSPVDISTLTKISSVIKTQGFKNVVISEITTTKKTAALAEARVAAIKKFIKDKVGSAAIKFEVVAPASRTYMNIVSVKG